MRPGFQRNVKDFTETVLNPDKLRTKQVSGETVTCESIVKYINVRPLHDLILLHYSSEVDRMLPRLSHAVSDDRFRREFQGSSLEGAFAKSPPKKG